MTQRETKYYAARDLMRSVELGLNQSEVIYKGGKLMYTGTPETFAEFKKIELAKDVSFCLKKLALGEVEGALAKAYWRRVYRDEDVSIMDIFYRKGVTENFINKFTEEV